jgi:hypothetical protein
MFLNNVTASSNSFGVSSIFVPCLRISPRWMSMSKGGKESCFFS